MFRRVKYGFVLNYREGHDRQFPHNCGNNLHRPLTVGGHITHEAGESASAICDDRRHIECRPHFTTPDLRNPRPTPNARPALVLFRVKPQIRHKLGGGLESVPIVQHGLYCRRRILADAFYGL